MIVDEQIYLEHFGVKGMHWGVRQKAVRKKAKSIKKTARSNANKHVRREDRKFKDLTRKEKNIAIADMAIGAASLSVFAGLMFLDSHPITLTRKMEPDTFHGKFSTVSKKSKKGARETTGHEGGIPAATVNRGKDYVQKELGFGFGREPDR